MSYCEVSGYGATARGIEDHADQETIIRKKGKTVRLGQRGEVMVVNEEEFDVAECEEPEVNLSPEWVVVTHDAREKKLALLINSDEVDALEPIFAYGISNCDYCQCALESRGLYVDGKQTGSIMWGNMCARCFGQYGEGIGWGKGQLYARQPNGDWRCVAGFDPG